MTNIASNLTFYRKRSGLTQGQLGELLHVSAQAISKWETGQAEPGLDMVIRLAEIYHITIDELLTATPDTADAPQAPNAPAVPAEKKPSAFVKSLKRFWYIPVAVLVAAAIAVALILTLTGPARYGRAIKSGDLQIGMTESEVKSVLGIPNHTTVHQAGLDWWIDESLNYEDAKYYVYYEERDAKNDTELLFGVEYRYLRIVFDENGKLIEAFYNDVPSTDIFGYGETEHLTVRSFAPYVMENGYETYDGTIVFTNGSVYLGPAYETTSDTVRATIGEFPLS